MLGEDKYYGEKTQLAKGDRRQRGITVLFWIIRDLTDTVV